MSRALTIFFGLLALGVVAYICLGHRPEIQSEVAANARAELAAGDFAFARVSADGQHLTLTGTAPSDDARAAAGQAALGAYGVVAVDNQITVETLVPPPGPDPTPAVRPQPQAAPEPVSEALRIVLDGTTQQAVASGHILTSSSAMSDDDTAPSRTAELSTLLSAALPAWQIESDLTPDANQPLELDTAVQQLVPLLGQAESASMDVDVEGIRVEAKLASFAERSALQAQLDGLADAPAFAARNLSWLLDSPPATVDGCQAAFDELLGADSILFTTSKAAIRGSSLPLLDKLARVARDCDVAVDIGGHTDSRGSAEFNNYLSLERARAVRNYLIANGVDAERVTAQGFGSTKPIADNNTVNGRQRNRRIEFRVLRSDS